MAGEPLPPDPDSVEKWAQMPHNKPSRDALPPATGGLQINRVLLIGFGAVLLVVLVAQLLAGR